MEITNTNIYDLMSKGEVSWNRWINELTRNRPTIEAYSYERVGKSTIKHISFKIAEFPTLELESISLSNYNFSRLKICNSKFSRIIFENCIFFKTQLDYSQFVNCKFINCNFTNCSLLGSNLNFSIFIKCNFSNGNLSKSENYKTYFEKCTFVSVNLMWSRLIETKFQNSTLFNVKIYGASIWEPIVIDSTIKDLIITKKKQSEIKVDDLEIAQFLYMFISNEKIRNIITSLTSKVVLILGRFTNERLEILEGIKKRLTELGFIPVLFTFSPSPNRDITETIQLIANISKLVIADITDPKSIPQELSHIIPNHPSLPVQPIMVKGTMEYGMYEHWKRYSWVKDVFEYRNINHLINDLHLLIQ